VNVCSATLLLEAGGISADTVGMFLRSKTRKKDGKEHRYWSVVENRRVADGRVVQRHVLYLGRSTTPSGRPGASPVEVFDEDRGTSAQMALFPEDRQAPELACAVVQVKLRGLQLRRPRQWARAGWRVGCGTCCNWTPSGSRGCRPAAGDALAECAQDPGWLTVSSTRVANGADRHWYDHSAMGDLLGETLRSPQPHPLSLSGSSPRA